MNPRWQKVDELFHSALARPPHERVAFLEQACSGDRELRSRVEALLSAYQQADTFMEEPAFEALAKGLAEEQTTQPLPYAIEDRTIGQYRVLRQLGRGGMGDVYLAHDGKLGREVALKLLPPQFTTDPERLRRFDQEARAASAINHPNILTVYEIGQLDSIRYMVMEFVDGVNLRQHMADKPMKATHAVELAMQIASALSAAHARGIIHRDIKPENIMIRKSRYLDLSEIEVKVVDFGIAKLIEPDVVETDLPTRPLVSTAVNRNVGTPSYMSPEQAQGLKLDVRTDIWSLGVVLYEMLAGCQPFTGNTENHVIVSVLEKEPTPLRRIADVPPALEAIVCKALRKHRDERYQTAKQLYLDLKELHYQLKRSETRRPRIVDWASTFRPTSKSVAVLAITLMVLGGMAYWLWRSSHPAIYIPFLHPKMDPLTKTGKASYAAISPNGEEIAHVSGPTDHQSLSLLHVATSIDDPLVAPNGNAIKYVSFSPNGEHVYFVRTESGESTLDEVSIRGGPVKSIIKNIDTAATFSPDGQHLAFFRDYPDTGEGSLIVANVDGSDEQKLVTHDRDDLIFSNLITSPAWSHDGERIAIALRGSGANSAFRNVTTVNVKDKTEKQISSEKWNTIHSMSWYPKDSGLLVTAIDPQRQNTRLWYVSYPSGAARQLTLEITNYTDISITSDGTKAATVLSEGTSDIWVIPTANPDKASKITSNRFDGAPGLDWTPDNRIVHGSNQSDNRDLWIINVDGTNNRQLTSAPGLNLQPSVTPDGRYIVFQSDRNGSMNIYRMDLDGSNQKQLTFGRYDINPRTTEDNQIIFVSNVDHKMTVWKVSIDGGKPVRLFDYPSMTESVSFATGNIAFSFQDVKSTPPRWRYGVLSHDSSQAMKTFDFPVFWEPIGCGFYGQNVRWTADGKALTYVDNKNDVSNIWAQPLDGSRPRQLTKFTSDLIFFYAMSRDGKNIAVARGSKVSDVVLITDLDKIRASQ